MSIHDVRQERFIPQGSCDCPPELASEATGHQSSREFQTSASEEGTSHLTDDGWAEAQRKIDVIGSQLVDAGIVVEAIPDCVASDDFGFAAS